MAIIVEFLNEPTSKNKPLKKKRVYSPNSGKKSDWKIKPDEGWATLARNNAAALIKACELTFK